MINKFFCLRRLFLSSFVVSSHSFRISLAIHWRYMILPFSTSSLAFLYPAQVGVTPACASAGTGARRFSNSQGCIDDAGRRHGSGRSQHPRCVTCRGVSSRKISSWTSLRCRSCIHVLIYIYSLPLCERARTRSSAEHTALVLKA